MSRRDSTRQGIVSRAWALLAAVALGLPAAAWGEIRTKTLANGTTMVYNEASSGRGSVAPGGSLRPVPRSEIADLIARHARRVGLEQRLVQAVVQVESAYDPRARSRKGAMGLMQLMPDTARSLRVSDAYDPDQNIRGGTNYLRQMLNRFSGNLTLALAAYNAGPSAVERYRGVPPYRETRNYVRKVMTLFRGERSSPLALHQDFARSEARRRMAEAPVVGAAGGKVYLTRDADNNYVFTSQPPRSR